MARTYIKCHIYEGSNRYFEGGVFMDQISQVRKTDDGNTELILSGVGHGSDGGGGNYADKVLVKKPIEEVEKSFLDARETPVLDWLAITYSRADADARRQARLKAAEEKDAREKANRPKSGLKALFSGNHI